MRGESAFPISTRCHFVFFRESCTILHWCISKSIIFMM
jgi:hypothetical protein